MNEKILLRSFMFVPANNKKYINKAIESKADAIILDLEDSVPIEQKSVARENIINYCTTNNFDNKRVFIRINALGTNDFVEDISQLILKGIYGLMPSKIMSSKDVVFLDNLLRFFELKNGIMEGKIKLAPLIETASAVSDINQIAKSSDRLVALCFGGEDYLNDIGSIYTYQEDIFALPRAMIINAARSEGLLPIDTPYLRIADIEGFERIQREAYRKGFAGCLLLNPKQIDGANRAFSPKVDDINHARKVIETARKVTSEKINSVTKFDDEIVGPPMQKKAENVMKQYELIETMTCK